MSAEVLHSPHAFLDGASPSDEILARRSVFYTPSVSNTPRQIEQQVEHLSLGLSYLVEDAAQLQQGKRGTKERWRIVQRMDLLVVDEADRLKTTSLEQLRDIYDRGNIGLIFIGMPGLEKRLSRYAQLYSRVRFVHAFRPLSSEDAQMFLQRQWREWGHILPPESVAETDATAAILRITSGNFRLLHRLLAQIERIVHINALRMVTKEVVEIARQQLVIGST